MWALASVVRWHGTALLTVAAHADSGLSAPAVICQTERMQGSEFLELREREKRWRKWEREEWHEKKKKTEREQGLAAVQMLEYTHYTHTEKHTELWTPCWVSDTDAARLISVLSLSLSHLLISVIEETRQMWRCNDVVFCCCTRVWCERLKFWVRC